MSSNPLNKKWSGDKVDYFNELVNSCFLPLTIFQNAAIVQNVVFPPLPKIYFLSQARNIEDSLVLNPDV